MVQPKTIWSSTPQKPKKSQPIQINWDSVERVSDFKLLGLHLGDDLSWKINTTAMIKKAQQQLNFLRVLKNNTLAKELLVSFYRCSTESTLTYCIPVWSASSNGQEKTSLQRVINKVQRIYKWHKERLDLFIVTFYLPALLILHMRHNFTIHKPEWRQLSKPFSTTT